MDKQTLENLPKIELQAEKPHRVIGDIPKNLLIWSGIVMLLIVIALIVVICFIPIHDLGNKTILSEWFINKK